MKSWKDKNVRFHPFLTMTKREKMERREKIKRKREWEKKINSERKRGGRSVERMKLKAKQIVKI